MRKRMSEIKAGEFFIYKKCLFICVAHRWCAIVAKKKKSKIDRGVGMIMTIADRTMVRPTEPTIVWGKI